MYVEINGSLTPFQIGFRNKVSTQDAILSFIEALRHETEISNLVFAVLLDLSKTFDSLRHQNLVQKRNLRVFSIGLFNSLKVLDDEITASYSKWNGLQFD